MARKALKNEKNISYDEQKKRYYVCFDYGKDESGKRRKQYKTYETKEEAIKARNQFQNDRINGTLIQPSKIMLMCGKVTQTKGQTVTLLFRKAKGKLVEFELLT